SSRSTVDSRAIHLLPTRRSSDLAAALSFFAGVGTQTAMVGRRMSRPGRAARGRCGETRMKWLTVLKKIAPEVTELVERRHAVLQSVVFAQPIGRRALASRLGWPERMVRKEIEFLRGAGLLVLDAGGMVASAAGERILEQLKGVIRELHGLAHVERA